MRPRSTTYVDWDMRAVAGLERKIAIISCSSLTPLHAPLKILRHEDAVQNVRTTPPKQREQQFPLLPPPPRSRCMRLNTVPSVRSKSRVVLCVSPIVLFWKNQSRPFDKAAFSLFRDAADSLLSTMSRISSARRISSSAVSVLITSTDTEIVFPHTEGRRLAEVLRNLPSCCTCRLRFSRTCATRNTSEPFWSPTSTFASLAIIASSTSSDTFLPTNRMISFACADVSRLFTFLGLLSFLSVVVFVRRSLSPSATFINGRLALSFLCRSLRCFALLLVSKSSITNHREPMTIHSPHVRSNDSAVKTCPLNIAADAFARSAKTPSNIFIRVAKSVR